MVFRYTHNIMVFTASITSDSTKDVAIPLIEGETNLSFYVSESCNRPVDIKNLQSTNGRCLGIAIQNLSIMSLINNTTILTL